MHRLEPVHSTLPRLSRPTAPEAVSSPDRPRLVGGSRALDEVRARIRAAALTRSTVLVTGETGTGKGVVARMLHAQSPRRCAPFVHVDCASIAAGTLESELFGHERGAFTGAHVRRQGRLELAGHGTLFLDEIGELPPHLQSKLLRVLQDRTFERVGGNQTFSLRARVVAATNRDLGQDVQRRCFRADLYYRLNVLRIQLPPLRERPGDLVELARHGHARLRRELEIPGGALTPEFLEALGLHSWPGNVRELLNVLERCLARSEGRPLRAADLVESLDERPIPEPYPDPAYGGGLVTPATRLPARPTAGPSRRSVAAAHERSRIEATLRDTGGNVSRAARRLGMSRGALRYRIAAFGLQSRIPRD